MFSLVSSLCINHGRCWGGTPCIASDPKEEAGGEEEGERGGPGGGGGGGPPSPSHIVKKGGGPGAAVWLVPFLQAEVEEEACDHSSSHWGWHMVVLLFLWDGDGGALIGLLFVI